MTSLPFIFDIRRGSTDDGPGIRTTVFFKGCPLSCIWCHNPESMSPEPALSFAAERCIGAVCAACAAVCHAGKKQIGMAAAPGNPLCSACGECAAVCPTGARRVIGRVYTLDELCTLLLKDIPFYRASKGGVTLSGGEPTLHNNFVTHLLQRLKKERVHTAIQTCGAFETDPFFNELLPFLDIVYFDLKLFDPLLHKRYTGRDNARILANLFLLSRFAPERLMVRVPLVPGITATVENLSAIAKLVGDLRIGSWELLPFNPGGIAKRRRIGREAPQGLPESYMERAEEERLREIFRQGVPETCNK
jgi:pyruvate formate lyase activating enzyme